MKLVNVTSALAGNIPHYVGTSSRIVYKLIPHLVSLKDLGSCEDQGGKNLVLNCEIVSCDVRKEVFQTPCRNEGKLLLIRYVQCDTIKEKEYLEVSSAPLIKTTFMLNHY